MPKYVYTDRNAGEKLYQLAACLWWPHPTAGRLYWAWSGKKIFECEAEDIEEADRLLLAATGIAIEEKEYMKYRHICCEVFP